MNDPRYAFLIMVDKPKPNEHSHGYATGGWVAAPAVHNVVERVAPLVGLPRVPDTDAEEVNDLLHHGERRGSRMARLEELIGTASNIWQAGTERSDLDISGVTANCARCGPAICSPPCPAAARRQPTSSPTR